ncbi:MAG: 8-amino-7-oxononanoate synthase [Planctomycetes bacterium]|nr:8-amino-7-oxononanoate synthase [Planctomycetota bacterium]
MSQPEKHPLAWIGDELDSLETGGLMRRRTTQLGPTGAQCHVPCGKLVNFGSNDYLGLARDARLIRAVSEALDDEAGWGSGASPLVTGYAAAHRALEQRLAEFEDTGAALLFSSGFAANVGTIAALVGRGDAIFGDEKNHASIIDGGRLSRAEVNVYPHRDVARLEEMLRESSGHRRRLIVTDSLFSMDGDLAPLVELADLAERYDCMLMVDEAHATGVFGRQGRGVAEMLGVERGVHIRVGTLSKALGCAGGFVAGDLALIDWLVNRARPYVFSTAHPAAGAAAAIAALDIVRDEPERRMKLLQTAEQFRGALRRQGWNVGDSASQIVPVIVGDVRRTMELAEQLRGRGFFVPPIRPPSVPEGESLLRISLSHGHTEEMIAGLIEALGEMETP